MAFDGIRAAMEKRGFTEYANRRWSWGGVRPADGAVVLCVWEALETSYDKEDKILRAQVLWADARNSAGRASSGVGERTRHVQAIRKGARGLLLVGHQADPNEKGERGWRCAADAPLWEIVLVEPPDAKGVTHVRALPQGWNAGRVNANGDFVMSAMSANSIVRAWGTDGVCWTRPPRDTKAGE